MPHVARGIEVALPPVLPQALVDHAQTTQVRRARQMPSLQKTQALPSRIWHNAPRRP